MAQTVQTDAAKLMRVAEILEREIARTLHSQPLIYKARRALEEELHQFMMIRQVKDTYSPSAADIFHTERAYVVRECWVMIECATLIL